MIELIWNYPMTNWIFGSQGLIKFHPNLVVSKSPTTTGPPFFLSSKIWRSPTASAGWTLAQGLVGNSFVKQKQLEWLGIRSVRPEWMISWLIFERTCWASFYSQLPGSCFSNGLASGIVLSISKPTSTRNTYAKTYTHTLNSKFQTLQNQKRLTKSLLHSSSFYAILKVKKTSASLSMDRAMFLFHVSIHK